tara:strand:- start:1557 stop:2633 length:1077 start_codon:yes stop_codon:yes gene_type:complete
MSKAAELANLIGNINAGGGGVNRNLIVNGKMAISQRSTSETGKTSGNYYTVDRFRTDHNGFTGTYTQATDVPSGYGFSNSFKIENTSVASSNGGRLRIDQRIEAQNLRNSGWDYTNSSSSLSYNCWVKSSVAGTYYVGFRTDDGTSRQFTKAFTVSANTWSNVSFAISGDSNVSFNNDNGMGALLAIHVDETTGESDSGHTLNGWQNYSASSRTPDFTQKWTETANATFLTTGWQLEVGQNPTVFEHEPIEMTLERCQRYFWQGALAGGGSYGGGGNIPLIGFTYPKPMRATPSASWVSGGIASHGGADYSITGLYNPALVRQTNLSTRILFTQTGSTGSNTHGCDVSGAIINFNAEL